MKHLISTKQFTKPSQLQIIFNLADKYQSGSYPPVLENKVIANIFYEPSTRTRLSFETAALKLGAKVISTENAAQFSSAAKGETLEDTIKIIGSYVDAIILRHFEKGASQKAAIISRVSIINAGDGTGEHPSQALLDIYTIKKELGSLENLNIALVGDLKNGRTIHSLLNLLSLYQNNTIYLVSPLQLKLPKTEQNHLKRKNINLIEQTNLEEILPKIDVLYMTRIQKERFASEVEYESLKNFYQIDQKKLNRMKKRSIILHPLPRINEISKEIDSDERAAYFRQAQNGLYIRMALLELLLG